MSRTGSPHLRSASALALAAALAAGPAHAQLSYNAPDPTVQSGNVTFLRGQTPGVEIYDVNTPTAVLDFTPSDTGIGGGTINFQNAGTSVTYQSTGNFTVLNRIVPADPTRAIQFNGTVNSRIPIGSATPGGSVWFYSPGGIVLGAGAVFDVGSLLLATGDPTGGTGTIGSTNSFAIASKADSGYAVTIQPGAQIKATPEGSYVALVAPVVRQDGNVRVNGAAAYVAAEQATLTINQGLFDIGVAVGSDGGGTPLIHGGVTGGPSSTGTTGDNHGIYMVAVPKNTAITMLIAPTGDLGFDVASQAGIENGAIYLQAGGDVQVIATNPVESRIDSLPNSPLSANISLAGGNAAGIKVTSNLIAQATGDTVVQSSATNRLISLQGDSFIYSGKAASLTNKSGQPFTAVGRVIVNAVGLAAGQANVLALAGSSMTFQDDLDVYASPYNGRGYSSNLDPTKGGVAFLQADGVGATIATNAPVRVFSQGIDFSQSKNTFGGSARVLATNGGQIGFPQALTIDATATAFNIGQTATGGIANLEIDQGSINVTNLLTIAAGAGAANGANAQGGSARLFAGANGGTYTLQAVTVTADATPFGGVSIGAGGFGKGGLAAVDLSTTTVGTTATVANITLSANGRGGAAATTGGAGTGGTTRMQVFKGTTLTMPGSVQMFATATGATGGLGSAGGSATGGNGQVSIAGALTFNSAELNFQSNAGAGGAGPSPTTPGGAGGAALAGIDTTIVALNGGTVTSGGILRVVTDARGGEGGAGQGGTGLAGSGGSAAASKIRLDVNVGSQIKTGSFEGFASATGGKTGLGAGQAATTGGSATGGSAFLQAVGTLDTGGITLRGDAFGGAGAASAADGGDALGGTVQVTASKNGIVKVGSTGLSITAGATGGANSGGGDLKAGSATGGFANLVALGNLSVAGQAILGTAVVGGAFTGTSGGEGGLALGGKSFIDVNGGDALLSQNVSLASTANGGANSGNGAGGAAVGGRARVNTAAFNGVGSGGSTLTFNGALSMQTDGFGGSSIFGVGGAGYAGQAPITGLSTLEGGIEIHSLGGAININTSVNMTARGVGGAGGTGGLGNGGRANVIAFGGDIKVAQNFFAGANGTGGSGSIGIGGEAGGGIFNIQTQDGGFGVPAGTPASITMAAVTALADARGGDGQTGGAAGRGGFAGATAFGAQNKINLTSTLTLTASGTGGSHRGEGPGAGALGLGGTAQIGSQGGAVTLGDAVNIRADAQGGSVFSSVQGTGGEGRAGTVFYFANKSGTVTQTAGSITLSAAGFGGSTVASSGLGQGGEGIGGIIDFNAFGGGTIDATANFITLDASGDGGSALTAENVTGGIGRGGNARVLANAGTLILRSNLDVNAEGLGGSAGGTGNGGAGIGGEARLGTFGAVGSSRVQVDDNLFLNATGQGGSAQQGRGGDGLGGAPPNQDTGPFDKGAYLVATGGEVTIGGDVIELEAGGRGGIGAAGGGAGIGGLANIVVFGASISGPGALSMIASGEGGDGEFTSGAAGGLGKGGNIVLAASSGGDSQGGGVIPLGTPGTVSFSQTFLDASGTGGSGGDGALGQTGGTGGDGLAGRATATAQAGSGTLKTDNLFLFVQGVGGDGGDGGDPLPNQPSTGGAGGKGGAGTGGFTNFGTASGPETTVNNGSATFGLVNAFVNGIGGAGGEGIGTSAGGAGGVGTGGTGALISRGSPVVLTTMVIDSSGFGGTGGAGATQGAGGAATGGSASLFVTNRFNRPERGSLTASDVSLIAATVPGMGSTNGATTAGQAFVQVTKADATIGTLGLSSFGDTPPAAGFESGVLVDAGTLILDDTLTIAAVGDVKLSVVNDGLLRAPSLNISTTGSLLPAGTGTPGLIDIAGDFFASFGGDFITPSSFDVDASFTLSAVGKISVGDIKAGDSITVQAQGPVTLGSLTAALNQNGDFAGGVSISTLGNLTVGNIKAATVDFQIGDAANPVSVSQAGSITAETISLDVAGSLTTGDIATGDFYAGIDTSFDNYLIGIGVAGDVKVGVVNAFTSVGIGSIGGKVETGAIQANDSVMLLAATGITTGGITAGTGPTDSVFVSNTSIIETNPDFAVLQDFDELGGEFDIAVLATATPVRVGGRVELGAVSAQNFAGASTKAFVTSDITAPNRLFLDVGTSISTGALTTNGALTLSSGTGLVLGDLKAGSVDLKSPSAIATGAITATGAIKVDTESVASFNGLVSGPTIEVISSNLFIGPNGRLGTAATESLTLTARRGRMALGNDTDENYEISRDEAGALRARNITLSASSISVQGVAFNGSAAGDAANLVGETPQLTLNSTGDITVDGALTINNAATGDRLVLSAGQAIEVATDRGGEISVFADGGEVLGGTLRLNASAIRVATTSLLEDLLNLTPEQRFQALRTPPQGSPRASGWLSAGRILFETDQLFIQNSNTSGTFGGFSAGSRGANLRGRQSATVDAIIFGRIADSTGAFKINADAVPLLTLNTGEGTTLLTATSSFNTCAFTGPCAAVEPPPPPPPPEEEEEVEVVIDRIANVVAATIADALASTADPETVAALPTVNLITTIDTGPLRSDPVISDPVTGGGNPSLWEGSSEPDEGERERREPAPGGDGQ